jgi:hypothetical protein
VGRPSNSSTASITSTIVVNNIRRGSALISQHSDSSRSSRSSRSSNVVADPSQSNQVDLSVVEPRPKKTCQFCGREYSKSYFLKHKKTCKDNPINQTLTLAMLRNELAMLRNELRNELDVQFTVLYANNPTLNRPVESA